MGGGEGFDEVEIRVLKLTDLAEHILVIDIGKDDDRDTLELRILAHFLDDFYAVLDWHLDVEEEDIRFSFADQGESFSTIDGCEYIVSGLFEFSFVNFQNILVIIDDTDGLFKIIFRGRCFHKMSIVYR